MTLSVNPCGAQLFDESHLMNSERHARALSWPRLRYSLSISLKGLNKTIFSPGSRLCCCQYWNRKLLNTSRKSDEGKGKSVAQLNVPFELLPEETYGNNDK